MSQLIKAADECRKLIRALQKVNLADLAAALDKAGSFEQAQKEAEANLKALGAQIAEANADLKKIRDKVKKADEEAKERFEREAEAAAGIHGQAIAAAKAEADAIIAAAQSKRDAVEQEVEKLNAKVVALNESIGAANKEHEAISANVEKVKAEAARLLGG